MKRSVYTFTLFALTLISVSAFGQAKKYPLYEHFTQASCGPCADQNPYFEAVYEANYSNMHHVAYHTSWPGYDPMYNFNPTESDAMVSFYGVTGVPDMFENGSDLGSPTAVTQDRVNEALTETSPIRILVTESTVGSTRNVHIEIQTVGTVPGGTYKVKAAAVERWIDYGSPPGTNGESLFPDVFRDMMTSTSGDAVTLAGMGGSTILDYSYTLAPEYDATEMYALVWVYNSSTKEVLNSGATGDPAIEVINAADATFVHGTNGSAQSFDGIVANIGDADMNMEISLASDQPGDWSSSFTFNGNTYTDFASASVGGLAELPLELNVNVGPTAAIGEYTFTVTFPDDPGVFPQVLKYYVISGVTDLVVNNEVGFGDGSPYGTWDWESLYTDGLMNAGVSTYAATSHFTMKNGFKNNALGDVQRIYYNVGWTFPALVDDATKIAYLEDFLDNGGDLMIAGQDIGWEVDYYAAYYPEAVDFYENYLQSTFVNDAAAGATQFTAVTTDAWYGDVATSDISKPYGTTYYYPDQIEPNGAEASAIFNYNNTETKIGGVRSETADYKTVYLGIGLEMVADEAVRNAIMDATYAYFTGAMNGVDYDAYIQALLGGASPNPASTSTTIRLYNIDQDYTITVTDITGKVVAADQIHVGAESYSLDVSNMESGMYFYFLSNGTQSTKAEKIQVIK
ncbi:MAG: T9SS type A sorting domain-containing protein [Chitinophagales bacterium]